MTTTCRRFIRFRPTSPPTPSRTTCKPSWAPCSTFNSGGGRWRVSAVGAGGQHNITFSAGAWTEMAPSCYNTQGEEELVVCRQRLAIEELLCDAFGRDHELALTLLPSARQFILTDRQGLRFIFRIPLELVAAQ